MQRFLLLSLSLFFGLIALAQIPQTIQYQGKLTDTSEVGQNDTSPMTFSIYDTIYR